MAGQFAGWRNEIKEMQMKESNRYTNNLASIHFKPSDHSQPPKVMRSQVIGKLYENIRTEQQKPISLGRKLPQSLSTSIRSALIIYIYIFQYSENIDGPKNIATFHYPKD